MLQIGIYDNPKKIIYAIKLKNEVTGTIIDLAEVEKFGIVSTNKVLKNQNGSRTLTDHLELVFTFHNFEIPEKVLEFYVISEFMPIDKERSQIENWS